MTSLSASHKKSPSHKRMPLDPPKGEIDITPSQVAKSIIVALDTSDLNSAVTLARQLKEQVSFFKIGLELFVAHGVRAIEAIRPFGRIMLDLKLHDIPNTVARTVKYLSNYDVSMLTVHAEAGVVAAAVAEREAMEILAVTILTSHSEKPPLSSSSRQSSDAVVHDKETSYAEPMQHIRQLIYAGFKDEKISYTEPMQHIRQLIDAGAKDKETFCAELIQRAQLAINEGAQGLVCSGLDAALVREKCGNHCKIVTPGIRPAPAADKKMVAETIEGDDQVRICTPSKHLWQEQIIWSSAAPFITLVPP